MKNIFKVIVSTLLFSCLSLGAFAVNTIEISDNTITYLDKTVDIRFLAEGFNEGDDLTILVFKVTEEHNIPHKSNIVYVEQPEYTEGMQSISFKLPEDAEGTYEVRVGGADVETYSVGRFTANEIIFGDLNNDGITDKNDAVIVLKVFFGDEILDNNIVYDLTGDGAIDLKDAIEILRMI